MIWTNTSPPDAPNSEWWHFYIDGINLYGYVSPYERGCKGWNWQAVRGDHRLSGSAETRKEAMECAEWMLSLTAEDFNERVAEGLLDELHIIERKLLRLLPAIDLLPGYAAGYESGVADTKRKIEEVLA